MVEVRQTLDGQRIENTLFFQHAGAIAPTDLVGLADNIRDWWAAELLPIQADALALVEVYCTDLTSETSETHTLAVVPQLPGAVTSPAQPNNVALCVSFRTSNRGRFARGRNYVAGLTEGQVTGSRVAISTADDIVLAYNAMGTYLDPSWTWVVCSRVAAGVPRAAGFNSPVVSAIVVDNVVDSQRRRLPGRGT